MIEGYNLMRHAGALGFLISALTRLPHPLTDDTGRRLGRSTGWLLRQLRAPPLGWGALPMLDLVEAGRTKTGGAALVLLMLIEWQRAETALPRLATFWPEGVPPPADLMPRLRNALLRERIPGGFNHMRDMATGRPVAFRSQFYTGQALLALIRSGHGAVAGPVLDAALKVPQPGLNHWLCYAAAEAISAGLPVSGGAWNFLEKEVAAHLARPVPVPEAGAIAHACLSEGLLAALRAARQLGTTGSFERQVLGRLGEHVTRQLESYADGQFRLSPEDRTVQIDGLQHNAESLLGLAAALTPSIHPDIDHPDLH